ncbi:MAG TPA: hypothetical protein VHL80_21285 [Polyangia bacterium]|nr:hypothetical protein [Polyangia bacterium]
MEADARLGLAPAGSPAVSSGPATPAPVLGAGWDFLLLGPGATLLVSAAYLGLRAVGLGGAASALVAGLSLLAVGPHYAATYRRAFTSREVLRAHPVVTLVAPVLLVAAAMLAVRAPATIGPFYFLGYVAWSGYHYSGQSLGLAMLFPLRQRARLDAREKRLLALPLYVSWLASLVGLAGAQAAARNPAYRIVRETFAPVTLPHAALLALVLPCLLSTLGVAVVARERRRRGVPLPLACYGVIGAQMIWFGFGLFFPFFNIVLVPIFHSLQYLALTGWHHARGERSRGLGAFAAYVSSVLVLGLVINPGLLVLFVPGGGSPRADVAAAAVISAINLHHFLMDGRIWRMREPKVARAFAA